MRREPPSLTRRRVGADPPSPDSGGRAGREARSHGRSHPPSRTRPRDLRTGRRQCGPSGPAERRLAEVGAARLRVVVAEVIDQLLAAHRVGRRALAILDEAAHVAVGRGVDVDREGRDRLLLDLGDAVGITFNAVLPGKVNNTTGQAVDGAITWRVPMDGTPTSLATSVTNVDIASSISRFAKVLVLGLLYLWLIASVILILMVLRARNRRRPTPRI